jgi:GNAT superfamily N-acetyltransferase
MNVSPPKRTPIPFILTQEILPSDHFTIASQAIAAFAPDTHTNLKLYGTTPEPLDSSYIASWLTNPECHVLKAVSVDDPSIILGSICWGTRGYILREPKPETTSEGSFGGNSAPDSKIAALKDLTGSHFRKFMTEIMPHGTKCWYVGSLNVAPEYQGMGIGTALLEWGIKRVAEDGVFAWAHSSEMGWRAYAKCGFEIVRTLRVDLDGYADGESVGKGPNEGGKWGEYVFRYMVFNKAKIPSGFALDEVIIA